MEEKEMTFKVLNDEGVEVECEVLFTFENDETKKTYIVYTDNTVDDDGETKVYANVLSIEDEDDDGSANAKLLPIETESEYDIIENILERLQTEEGISDLLDESNLTTEMRDYFMDGMK